MKCRKQCGKTSTGARVIKIAVDRQKYACSADDIRFIVAEAARARVKVAAHVQTGPGAHAAIEAGVASIEYGWVLSEEDLALARKEGVVLASTDFTVAGLLASGMEPEAAKRTHEPYVARLKRAWAAGLNVVFGTDVMSDVKGRTRGELAMEYIDSFREAGISASNILRAMTTHAAALLGVEKERGAIRPGMAADLVATPVNPLREIDGLKRIGFVMKDGQIQQALRKLLTDIDVLVSPTRFGPASRITDPLDRPSDRERSPSRARGLRDLTAAGNLAGLPALSCGLVGGLPVAIQLVGRPFSENTLLAIGREFQLRTDWHKRRPPA